jgi:hypothetical protein
MSKYVHKTPGGSVRITVDEGYNRVNDLRENVIAMQVYVSNLLDFIEKAKKRNCNVIYIHVNDTSRREAGCYPIALKSEPIGYEND